MQQLFQVMVSSSFRQHTLFCRNSPSPYKSLLRSLSCELNCDVCDLAKTSPGRSGVPQRRRIWIAWLIVLVPARPSNDPPFVVVVAPSLHARRRPARTRPDHLGCVRRRRRHTSASRWPRITTGRPYSQVVYTCDAIRSTADE